MAKNDELKSAVFYYFFFFSQTHFEKTNAFFLFRHEMTGQLRSRVEPLLYPTRSHPDSNFDIFKSFGYPKLCTVLSERHFFGQTFVWTIPFPGQSSTQKAILPIESVLGLPGQSIFGKPPLGQSVNQSIT